MFVSLRVFVPEVSVRKTQVALEVFHEGEKGFDALVNLVKVDQTAAVCLDLLYVLYKEKLVVDKLL